MTSPLQRALPLLVLTTMVTAVACHLNWDDFREILRELSIQDVDNQPITARYAAEWLAQYNADLAVKNSELSEASYNYLTHMNDENSKKYTETEVAVDQWNKGRTREAHDILRALPDQGDYLRRSHYRMLRLIVGGEVIANDIKVSRRISELGAKLEKIYGTTKVEGKTLDDLELDIKEGTYDDKLKIWRGWRDAVGPKMRPIFTEYMQLLDQAAKDSGFSDMKEAWIVNDFGYETKDLEGKAERLWLELTPLYEQLHAYIRRRLHNKYGDLIDLKGPIPAHLLGNMWAQHWGNVDADVLPYPNRKPIQVTDTLQEQNYTAYTMMELAESFFVSIGLEKMTPTFWEKSMLTRPEWDVQCHASAEDLFRKGDFRIKMCTVIGQDDLVTMHHEMGHIEYFMEYSGQPAVFRTGANAAFHEAIGDTIALSVTTPKHFEAIGLLPATTGQSHEDDLNYLMKQALTKIAFLPFGYLIDKYRWKIFTKEITDRDYNSKWWELRENIQGVKSSVPRTEEHFDPGAKYHIASNVPYIRYFFSHIGQFQFHEAMCVKSGNTDPPHRCDFYKSQASGTLLKSMLQLGRSRPWQQAMEMMTGETDFNTRAILRYFEPLQTWLEAENSKNQEYIGW